MNIDSVDPIPLARWWAELLGWRITFEQPDEVVLEPPEGSPEDGSVDMPPTPEVTGPASTASSPVSLRTSVMGVR